MDRGYRLSRSDIAYRAALLVGAVLGAAGPWVAVGSALAGMHAGGGCALAGPGAIILLLLYLLALGWLTVLAVVTFGGIVFIWIKYDLGAGLIVGASIAALATIGLLGPSRPGDAAATWEISAATAFLAATLLALLVEWVLRLKARRDRLIAAAILVVTLSPFAVLCGAGLYRDVQSVSTVPAPVLTAGCGARPA